MPQSIEDIIAYNKRFWSDQARLLNRRLSSPEIATAAYALVQDDANRGIPVAYRRSYETAAQDAEVAVLAAAPFMRSAQARRAGSAKKGDLLTKLMRKIVAQRPEINEGEVLEYLRKNQGDDGIYEVTGTTISMESRQEPGRQGTGGKTEFKDCPISGLKDRLSRIKSEIPPR